MRDVVRSAFIPFTAPLEGVVPFLYLDVLGLVTTAIGNLVDSPAAAIACPFRRHDGERATPAEITAEWERVKARQDLRLRGGMVFKSITTLRLDDAGVALVVGSTLDRMDRQLAERFPGYKDWPADAQLATLSMAWACGPAFRFPALEAALRDEDFLRASNECRINTKGNPGVIPRNERNRVLYRNAAAVVASGLVIPDLEPDVLYWPLSLETGPAADDTPTLPALDDVYRAEGPSPIVTVLPDTLQPCPLCGLQSCAGNCPDVA